MILVGFMGSGKTTVGRLLARRLGWAFVDVDREIVRRTGLAINDIFASFGEPFFRKIEKELLKGALAGSRRVVAAGGGTMCDPGNRAAMKEAGLVVCLTAPPETIAGRLAGDGTRPLLAGPERSRRVAELMEKRLPFYRQADLTVDTGEMSPAEAAERIERLLEEHG